MRLRMKMKVMVLVSVITISMLVFQQKKSFKRKIQLWLTLREDIVADGFKSKNESDDKEEWKHVKTKRREEETIYSRTNGISLIEKTIPTFRRRTVRRRTVWRTTVKRKTVGKTIVGRKSVGKTTVGRITVGKTTVGRTTVGRTTVGRTTVGRTTARRITVGRAGISDTWKMRISTDTINSYAECPKWTYKRQDWTIIYNASQTEYDNTNCSKPSYGKNVKRISLNDGTFINTGCSNKTSECKEYPFYDFKEGLRINTPPCCRHHLLTMLDHVTKELQSQSVPHCMISGGVIGWVRNKKMIPYDRDLDLIVSNDYWNTTEFWRMFQQLNEKYGYIADGVEEFKVKLYFSKLNRNNIDIWAYWAENNTLSIAFHGFKSQPIDTMMPFKAVNFEWFDIFVPAKPIQYLDRQYGKEVWRPEKQCMVRNAHGDCW